MSDILTREVIEEWAKRGERAARRPHSSAMEIGPLIKAELIALITPVVDCINRHGIAGAYIPFSDTPDSSDIRIDCHPLYEEIQLVLNKWGSIYVEVDATTSRRRIADSYASQRAEIEWLTGELKEAHESHDEEAQNLSAEIERLTRERDVAREERRYEHIERMIGIGALEAEIADLRAKLEAETKRLDHFLRYAQSHGWPGGKYDRAAIDAAMKGKP